MLYISKEDIENRANFNALVNVLREGFRSTYETPMRHHHDYKNPSSKLDSTLLLMPSWQAGNRLGVKVVNVAPENAKLNLPSIHGVYLLFDAATGVPKATLDGTSLTAKRTAAASALASSYLSNKNAKSLLMVGTGALSINLILAHASQRPIERVLIWGRSMEKAKQVASELGNQSFSVQAIEDLDSAIPTVDIISCATLSPTPLIKGKLLRAGQHIDLVGSYQKTTREADNDTIQRSTVFIDTFQGGLKESGDIVIPIQEGILSEAEIPADLERLCKERHPGRTSREEITVFKSVGHASEDLMAANYFYDNYEHDR